LHITYIVFQKISPPSCLRYNFFDPNPILIILAELYRRTITIKRVHYFPSQLFCAQQHVAWATNSD